MSDPLQTAAQAARLLAIDSTLCYGVECPRHGNCARYLAMDGARGDRSFIGSCIEGGVFPLYVAVTRAQQ